MGVEVPSNPINRKEQYLAKIAGQAVEIPAEPLTREEAYLNKIAKNGSGGGGGTGDYNDLENLPQVGGVTLQGNKSLEDLGIKNEFIGTTAEWNALTAEQKKAYDTYQITDDYTEGSGGLPNYSTTEQKTGQKWIDGKDIYVITAQNVATWTVLATGVDKIIDARIARHGKSENEAYKVFGDGFTQNDGGTIKLENGVARYSSWSSDGNLLVPTADHVIVYYTKNV